MCMATSFTCSTAGLRTIAIDCTMCARLFSIAFDFFAPALVASPGHTPTLLNRLGGFLLLARRRSTADGGRWRGMLVSLGIRLPGPLILYRRVIFELLVRRFGLLLGRGHDDLLIGGIQTARPSIDRSCVGAMVGKAKL